MKYNFFFALSIVALVWPVSAGLRGLRGCINDNLVMVSVSLVLVLRCSVGCVPG